MNNNPLPQNNNSVNLSKETNSGSDASQQPSYPQYPSYSQNTQPQQQNQQYNPNQQYNQTQQYNPNQQSNQTQQYNPNQQYNQTQQYGYPQNNQYGQQYPQYPQYPQYNYNYNNTQTSTGNEALPLILGIVSIVLSGTGMFSLIAGIIGIIFALSAKKKAAAIGIQPSSTVTAGLICSIIGVILSALITLFSILLLIVAFNTDESYSYSYNSTAFFSSVQSITDLCGLIF